MSNVGPQKMRDPEDSFHLQLAKAIQTWLWIEGELNLFHYTQLHLSSASP